MALVQAQSGDCRVSRSPWGTALVAATLVSVLFAIYSEHARRDIADEQAHTARERDDKDNALKVQREALNVAVAALRDLTDDVVEEQMTRESEFTDETKEFLRRIIKHFDALAAITADDAESRIIRAEGLHGVGLMRYRLGEMKEAEQAYRDAVAICTQLVAEFPTSVDYRRKLAQSQYNFGMLLRDTGRLPEAEKAYSVALAIRKELAAEFPTNAEFRLNLAQCNNNLGRLFMIKSQHREAVAAFTDVVAAYKQLVEEFPDRPVYRHELAGMYGNLGNVLSFVKRSEEAEQAYNAAHALRKQLAYEFPTNSKYRHGLASSHNTLGILYRTTKRYPEAESAFAEALPIYKQLVDDFPTRPEFRRELARCYNSFANLLYVTDKLKEAETAFGDAAAIQRKLAADYPNQPNLRNNLAGTLGNLGVLCNKRRDFAAAKAYLAEARSHHEAALKANPRQPYYRQYYRNNLITGVVTHAGLRDQSGAVELAGAIRDLGWDAPANAYDAACALARCIPIVEETRDLDAGKRRAAMQFYGDQAMTMLRAAIGKGFKDAERIASDDDLNALRRREDFAGLAADVRMQEKK